MTRASALTVLSLAFAVWGLTALANSPDSSLRPTPRPGSIEPAPAPAPAPRASAPATQAAPEGRAISSSLRPKPRATPKPGRAATVPAAAAAVSAPNRPSARAPSAQEQAVAAAPSRGAAGPTTSARPTERPESVAKAGLFQKRKLRRGSVCGVIDIQGTKVGAVPGSQRGCGVKDAVRVTSVSGVRLSQPAVMDCPTAQALNTWVERGLKPAFRRRGPVVEMRVAAHYICRTRNNKKGAKISEHGKGKAIDISAFTMKDGEVITVLKGWGRGTTLKPLSRAYKAACGPFGTTLGPISDRYHQDHFHFDTAQHRSGPYCK